VPGTDAILNHVYIWRFLKLFVVFLLYGFLD